MSTQRSDDAALWRSVAATLEDLVLPALKPGFERDSARQLVGLCRYATARSAAPAEERAIALAEVLGHEGNGDVADLPVLLGEAAELLVTAVRATTGKDQERAELVRDNLHKLQAEDIAEASPLLETFSGHAPVETSEDAVEVREVAPLTAWFESVLGTPVQLEASVMVGGHSRRMLLVKVTETGSGQVHDLVVRIEQGGMFGTEGTSEARVMEAVAQTGFPAPTVRWIVTNSDVVGQPFFVMDRAAGTPVVQDESLIDTYVATLGRLHQLDPAIATEGLGPVPATAEAAISANIDHYLGIYRDSVHVRIPLLEEAAEWLRANLRPTGPVGLVHGDPGVGNFLHIDGDITALTDWELAHYGDPAEDWTYFGAIRGRKLHDVATWRAKFAEHAGVKFEDRDWLAWEGFNQLKGACVNLTALRIFNEGVSTTPNLLAIGTAVHLRFLNRLTEIVATLR
jgi:aminoglycoside phosphotransferase (APT) family kinase protein